MTIQEQEFDVDINGLPEELVAQLSKRRVGSTLEEIVLKIISDRKTPTSLNQIIVGVWKEKNKVYKRANVNAIVAALKKKGLIERHGQGQTGVYKIPSAV